MIILKGELFEYDINICIFTLELSTQRYILVIKGQISFLREGAEIFISGAYIKDWNMPLLPNSWTHLCKYTRTPAVFIAKQQ